MSSSLPYVSSRFHGPLLCIFFAEFDLVSGPTVRYQCPADAIDAPVFDAISQFLIVAAELSHRNINVTVTVNERRYLTCLVPASLSNAKYARNAFHFSVGFVFDAALIFDRYRPYLPLLQKLAKYLETLEIETEFLSSPASQTHSQSHSPSLYLLLCEIWRQLSHEGQCTVIANKANKIFLRLHPILAIPAAIHSYDVPVLIRPIPIHQSPFNAWDLTLRELLPYINGVDHVSLIASKSHVSIINVKRVCQQLTYGDCLRCVDIFQFSNGYETTEKIARLWNNEELQSVAYNYIAHIHNYPTRHHHHPISTVTNSHSSTSMPLAMNELFALYAQLKRDLAMTMFCERNEWIIEKHCIDVRRLMVFGVLNGIIQRIHQYPIKVSFGASHGHGHSQMLANASSANASDHSHSNGCNSNTDEDQLPLIERVLPLCDGRHCLDELCDQFQVSHRRLMHELTKDSRIVLI